jgi:hypothetical protein
MSPEQRPLSAVVVAAAVVVVVVAVVAPVASVVGVASVEVAVPGQGLVLQVAGVVAVAEAWVEVAALWGLVRPSGWPCPRAPLMVSNGRRRPSQQPCRRVPLPKPQVRQYHRKCTLLGPCPMSQLANAIQLVSILLMFAL